MILVMASERVANETRLAPATAEVARLKAVEKSANERIANLTSLVKVREHPNAANVPNGCASQSTGRPGKGQSQSSADAAPGRSCLTGRRLIPQLHLSDHASSKSQESEAESVAIRGDTTRSHRPILCSSDPASGEV